MSKKKSKSISNSKSKTYWEKGKSWKQTLTMLTATPATNPATCVAVGWRSGQEEAEDIFSIWSDTDTRLWFGIKECYCMQ